LHVRSLGVRGNDNAAVRALMGKYES
jgi:hypothetical protein